MDGTAKRTADADEIRHLSTRDQTLMGNTKILSHITQLCSSPSLPPPPPSAFPRQNSGASALSGSRICRTGSSLSLYSATRSALASLTLRSHSSSSASFLRIAS